MDIKARQEWKEGKRDTGPLSTRENVNGVGSITFRS